MSFGAVHTLGMPQASSSVVELEALIGRGGVDCGLMGMARRRAAGPTVSAQAPGVLRCGCLPAANMRNVLVRPSAISTIEIMRSLFSPAVVSRLGGG